MTTITDPPRETFRLSMLLNDTRYRSMTFQAIAAILLALSIMYLGNNLLQNLRAAGLNIAYDFLGDPAGYDINQTLIEYDSQSSHARAAIVGVLNTLLADGSVKSFSETIETSIWSAYGTRNGGEVVQASR